MLFTNLFLFIWSIKPWSRKISRQILHQRFFLGITKKKTGILISVILSFFNFSFVVEWKAQKTKWSWLHFSFLFFCNKLQWHHHHQKEKQTSKHASLATEQALTRKQQSFLATGFLPKKVISQDCQSNHWQMIKLNKHLLL